jgi:hemerythrin superfamily protein
MDATELLKRDHDTVAKLFQRFRMGRGNRARRSVLEQICAELTVHAQIEEEIFYPAVRGTGDAELVEKVGEATREHAEIKAGVDALRARADDADGSAVEGMVTALAESVEHHVGEEEGELFPRVADVMDERQRADLGRRLGARKAELTGGVPSRQRRRARATRRPTTRRRRARTAGARRTSGAGKKTARAKKRSRAR